MKVLAAHPSAIVSDALNLGLVGATVNLLTHGPCDVEAWLPRRAAQVFTDFIRRLESVAGGGSAAAIELVSSVGAVPVTIPVYGTLLLPAPVSSAEWVPMVRRALVLSPGTRHHGQLVLKIGQHTAATILSLLPETGSLIFALRHPAETVIGLTETRVDGMRPEEAAHFVDVSLQHARRLLAHHSKAIVIRLESLVFDTDRVLGELARTMQLEDSAEWRKVGYALALTDVPRSPRWDHSAVVPYRAQIADQAKAWGYE